MSTATIELQVTPGVAMPTDRVYANWAGFKLTLTASSGNAVPTSVAQQTTWVFSDLAPGASYTLLIESVDANGQVIQALPAATITAPTAPAGQTFVRLDGFTVAWN